MYPVAIAAAACGFGAVSVVAKLAYQAGALPGPLFGARVLVAGLLLSPLAVGCRSRPCAASVALAVSGGAAFAAAGFIEFEALARLPASVLVPLVFISPLWILLGSWAVSGARPSARSVALYGLVAAGLALLVGGRGDSDIDPLGVGLGVSASVLFAVVFVLLEALVRREPAGRALSLMMAAAAVVAVAMQGEGVRDELIDSGTAPYAVAVGALSAGSLLLLALGMERTSAFRAAVISGVEPVAAAVLALALLGETLSPAQGLGGVAIVAGVTGVSVLGGHAG
jgi:drug/metabolite transporter (DMT)-like permease